MFYVSWGDLVALLLVFFIYLFSISEINVTKFAEATESFRTQNKFEFENKNFSDDLNKRLQAEQDQLKHLHERLNFLIEQEKLEDQVSAGLYTDRLEIDFKGALLFNPGEASLKASVSPILKEFTDILVDIQKESTFVVEGHSDDIPISTERYPSNWELSTARAAAVLKTLATYNLDESKFSVVGYGSHKPLVPNTSESNRAKNRRVKFILKANLQTQKYISKMRETQMKRWRENAKKSK
jgi:chemotaxis protein MotB